MVWVGGIEMEQEKRELYALSLDVLSFGLDALVIVLF